MGGGRDRPLFPDSAVRRGAQVAHRVRRLPRLHRYFHSRLHRRRTRPPSTIRSASRSKVKTKHERRPRRLAFCNDGRDASTWIVRAFAASLQRPRRAAAPQSVRCAAAGASNEKFGKCELRQTDFNKVELLGFCYVASVLVSLRSNGYILCQSSGNSSGAT